MNLLKRPNSIFISNNVSVLSNQIHLNTTGGKLAAGTAYGIQVSGPVSNFVIAYNNISTVNNGPNIGIYSQNYEGDTTLFIFGNTINVTGLAGEHNWALVAGIEVQDTNDTIWNNTIEVHNRANSTTGNAYGISYSQSTSSNHTYNIQYNKIKTDSNYGVYINANGTIKNTTVSNNVIVTKNHKGDDAVYVRGDGNYVGGNTGDESANVARVPQWLANVLKLMNALNSQGTGHSNNTGTGTGIMDDGQNQGVGGNAGFNILPFNGMGEVMEPQVRIIIIQLKIPIMTMLLMLRLHMEVRGKIQIPVCQEILFQVSLHQMRGLLVQ